MGSLIRISSQAATRLVQDYGERPYRWYRENSPLLLPTGAKLYVGRECRIGGYAADGSDLVPYRRYAI